MKPEPDTQRRFIRRQYTPAQIIRLFDIPEDEFVTEIAYDKGSNRLNITTIIDSEEEEGDI